MGRLRYVSTEQPGYTRKPHGSGFSYQDTQGAVIRDRALRAWIESIGIPPAWTDVWISPHQNGHILATGRDEKGRKQYRYHPDWQAARSQKKFDHLYSFGQHLPQIREVTDAHLRQRTLSRERVLAAVVRLLESTLIRIGNAEYTRQNDSYGLTTMIDDHAEVNGSAIKFDFIGKSGKAHTITLRDRRLASVVKRCQDIEGQDLFQYYDENDTPRVIGSADVNAYLQEITGEPFTAKVFRTWGGSTLAIKYLCEQCEETSGSAAARACVESVSNLLGNTKTICRKYYIHPMILDAHVDGTLQALYAECQRIPATPYGLTPEEYTLMRLIETTRDT